MNTQKTPEKVATTNTNSPGVIVLQWLSYAFWLGLAFVVTFIYGYLITTSLTGFYASAEALAYLLAAVLVLLPVALGHSLRITAVGSLTENRCMTKKLKVLSLSVFRVGIISRIKCSAVCKSAGDRACWALIKSSIPIMWACLPTTLEPKP